MEEEEEGEIKKLKGTYTIWVGDSVVRDKKVLINTNKKNKIFIKYDPVAGDTSTFIYTKVVYRSEGSKEDTSWPAKTWGRINVNKKSHFPLDSLPEGRYMVLLKDKKEQIDTVKFYLRNKKYDFACEVCGRDLTINLRKLKEIFPNNSQLTIKQAEYLTKALKTGNFNTCNRQAHFFAQVKVESQNFTDFEENEGWTIENFFNYFSNNKNIDKFFKQSFWDNNEHKKYFYLNVYEKLDSTQKGTYSVVRYIKVIRNNDTIKVPVEFRKDTTGHYKKVSYNQQERKEAIINLFSLMYANNVGAGNGAPETQDGYKYKGRGAIQITGKTTYIEVSRKANSLFKEENFNWQTNYEDVGKNDKDRICSAVAFFHWKLNGDLSLLDTDNVFQISVKLNGCKKKDKNGNCVEVNHGSEREKAYYYLKNKVFYNCDRK